MFLYYVILIDCSVFIVEALIVLISPPSGSLCKLVVLYYLFQTTTMCVVVTQLFNK
eukprot:m.39617 g.39617  ORF g.39617 m.39617 type:complete len:56 (+) comp10299_c1_seq2:457-624(+)